MLVVPKRALGKIIGYAKRDVPDNDESDKPRGDLFRQQKRQDFL
jgi:hypothetical protein